MAQIYVNTAILKLTSSPKARAVVNGKDMGLTPLTLKLKPGKETEIILYADGYKSSAEIYVLKAGEVRKEKIILERKETTIRITSEPDGAEIFLNGQQLLTNDFELLRTPAEIKLEYGWHNIILKLKLNEFQDLVHVIDTTDKDSGAIHLILQKPGQLLATEPQKKKELPIEPEKKLKKAGLSWWVWALIGVGVLGVAAAIGDSDKEEDTSGSSGDGETGSITVSW